MNSRLRFVGHLCLHLTNDNLLTLNKELSMKKTLFSLALVASMAMSAFAQETDSVAVPQSNWKLSGITGANTAQTALVNWSAGGENSVAWNVYLNATANYKINGHGIMP